MNFISIFKRFSFSSFIKSSGVYFTGNIANAVLAFLLIPVLTRYLSPLDYGVVGTSLVLVQMLTLLIGLNSYGLISRTHFDNNVVAQKRVVSTSILLSSGLCILFLILLAIMRDFIGTLTKFPPLWIPIMAIIAFFGVVTTIYLVLLQVSKEPKKYITIQIITNGLNIGIAIFLVIGIGMDWRGRILATIISGGAVAFLCLYILIIRLGLLRLIFDISSVRALLSFGIPLIPHFIGGWVMTMAPRLYLNNMTSLSDTGLYSVGYNMASPLALIIGAVNIAYLPELFERLSSKSQDMIKLAKMLLIGAASLPIIAGAYGIAGYLLIPLIVGHQFYGASDYIFWIAMAFSMQGVYFIFGNFVIYSKKTYLMAWRADFLGGIATLCFCPLMIKLNGPIGAAQSTFLAFAISTIGCFHASRKAYPMPWKKAALNIFTTSR